MQTHQAFYFNGKFDVRHTGAIYAWNLLVCLGVGNALEPKIVIPGVGPVGIENSWVVTNEGIEKLTNCNEEVIELS